MINRFPPIAEAPIADCNKRVTNIVRIKVVKNKANITICYIIPYSSFQMARFLYNCLSISMEMQIEAAPTEDGGFAMINATNNSLSALGAFRKKMDVTANNIANALTDKFKKSRVTLEESTPGGVKAVIDRVETQGFPKESIRDGKSVTVESSNVDLNEELPEMVITQTAYGANLKTLKAQNDMMGSLLDIFS